MTLPADDILLQQCLSALADRKAGNLVALDVHDLTSVADTFIVCSGSSNRQVTAIAEHVRRELRKDGVSPLAAEGLKEGHWALLDYGGVVLHIFYEPIREFYDLEGLWTDAPRLPVDGV